MRYYFLILLALVCALPVSAQSTGTSFDVDGIKVIFKPTVKEIINVSMYFRGGVNNYPASKAGIEQLALSATSECGTKLYTKNQFKNIEDEYSIAIGGSSDYDYSAIHLNCISKYFDNGWKLFSETINNPVFDARELDIVKTKLISAIKQDDSDPDDYAEQLAFKSAFQGTPYAIDPKGTEETISSFTQQEVKSYYQSLLNKNRMFLVVVGKISKEELIQKIRASFASLPSKPYQAPQLEAPLFKTNGLVSENRALATNYVTGIVNAPPMSSNDYVPFRLAISVLSGGMFSEIRTNLHLSYNPGAETKLLQMPYASIYVSSTDPKASVEAMVRLVKRLKVNAITPENLEYLKGSFITNNYMTQESSGAIASALGKAEIMGSWKLADQFLEKVNQATPEQMLEAARKYIKGIKWAYTGDAGLAKQMSALFDELTY